MNVLFRDPDLRKHYEEFISSIEANDKELDDMSHDIKLLESVLKKVCPKHLISIQINPQKEEGPDNTLIMYWDAMRKRIVANAPGVSTRPLIAHKVAVRKLLRPHLKSLLCFTSESK